MSSPSNNVTCLELHRNQSAPAIWAHTPINITAGPDGALWFTENAANKIGRITTDGVISEFTIPTADSSPFFITTGPDGAVWFTEAASSSITTAGVISEFPIPTANSSPAGITAGPDGALWFTELNSSKINAVLGSGQP
jgi:virginiamycin B lyase